MSELLHVLKNLAESVSDNSDVEQGIMAAETAKRPTRKRKWEVMAEISGSGNSSCSSPSVIPLGSSIGFLRKGSESNDENGDLSDMDGYTRTMVKGYDTATTAVITDSEDDLFFLEENRFVAEDQFALEYEPPATDDGGDDYDDDDDDEGSLSLHTSDDGEDLGAEGGDEFDEDEDDTDSEIDEDEMWSCSSCSTKNHPMTRHCTGCWGRRCEWLPTGLTRSSSAPVLQRQGVVVSAQSLSRSNSLCTSPSIEPVNNLNGQHTCTCPICMAVNFVPPVADKKSDDRIASGTDFVNVLTSGTQNSHIGITGQLLILGRTIHSPGTDLKEKLTGKDCKEIMDSNLDIKSRTIDDDSQQINASRNCSREYQTRTSDFHFGDKLLKEASKDVTLNEVSSSLSSLTLQNSSSELAAALTPRNSLTTMTSRSVQLENSLVPSSHIDVPQSLGTVLSDSGISNISLDADVDSAGANLLTHSQNEKFATTSAKDVNEEQQETSNTVNQNKSQTDVCIICLSQPRNASFVHGHTGHQVCCIECAEKMKATKKRCPVCRKKIQLVVKNFL